MISVEWRSLRQKTGAVLPMVLGVLLTVTMLLSSLLQTQGCVRRVALQRARTQQLIYDAESALIVHLEGLPGDFFAGAPWNKSLPNVSRDRLGPWADFSAPLQSGEETSAGSIHVLAGIACDSGCNMLKSQKLRRKIYEGFRLQLNREITMVKPPLVLEIKSGNRRLFGRIPSKALWVQDGDLSLDLNGKFPSYRFVVDGSVEVRGRADFDTLRVYARGPLLLRGQVKVRHLEAFSEDRVELSRGVEFSGVVVARHEVAFPHGTDHVVLRYPSFVMSLDAFGAELPLDSVLVPDYVDGSLKPFLWSIE
jgi:hypothetical protein